MNTNETVKKKSFSKAIIIAVVLAVIVLGVGFAYARYITKLNGNATADIAKWSLKINGSTNQNFVIDLAQTRTGVTQEAEVEENYIGPGTAGAFEIELDATGSEASLEYDINLNVNYTNNEVFPKNLIFYSDEEMTNAIYHDGNGINLNGFIGWNDNSQVHTKTIYWSWSYETGSTQNEINANDELDSYWIGKPISLSMNVTAKQVNENPTTGQYSVTFDANGGTLQGYGNSSQATKLVTYGDTYGYLPEPTREGYTFKGWNGKNMFDEETILMAIQGSYKENGNYVFDTGHSLNMYGGGIPQLQNFKENTQYVLTIEGYGIPYDNTKTTTAFRLYIKYTDGTSTRDLYTYVFKGTEKEKIIIKSDITKTIESISMYYGFSGKVYISFIQLEQGSTATSYEPYYITSSTEVVQNQNHTLTAIWEKE